MSESRVKKLVRDIRSAAYAPARAEFKVLARDSVVVTSAEQLVEAVVKASALEAAVNDAVESIYSDGKEITLSDYEALGHQQEAATLHRDDFGIEFGTYVRETYPNLASFWVGPLVHSPDILGISESVWAEGSEAQAMGLGGIATLTSRGRIDAFVRTNNGYAVRKTPAVAAFSERPDPDERQAAITGYVDHVIELDVTSDDAFIPYYDLMVLKSELAQMTELER